MGVKLGLHAKLYRNTGSAGTPAWNEITNVRDVTLNLETGEADGSTRGNGGWRANIGTLKGATLEFEMMWDMADDDFTAIREAFLNNTPIEFAVLDGGSSTPGSQGLRATMAIINCTRSEPLEEAIKVISDHNLTFPHTTIPLQFLRWSVDDFNPHFCPVREVDRFIKNDHAVVYVTQNHHVFTT